MLQAARKVFDTALATLAAMPQAAAQYRAPLALQYAEAELQKSGADTAARALHVLSWLATGGPFVPYVAGKGRQ